jgi:serine/threonine protein kinase
VVHKELDTINPPFTIIVPLEKVTNDTSKHVGESQLSFACGTRVDDFEIVRLVGHGGYGEVYAVRGTSMSLLAMKIESRRAKQRCLRTEAAVHRGLGSSPYFPALLALGSTDEYDYLVMEHLGPSLSQIRRLLPGSKFTAYSVLRLALEMLNCICAIHRRGFVHRDVKPGNFLIRPDRRTPISLIDFGCAYSYIDPTTNAHIAFVPGAGFTGTIRYASLNAHDGMPLSRRDDLMSWFYSVVEIAAGKLPWPGGSDRVVTVTVKERIDVNVLCQDLPEEFVKIYKYLNRLKFTQKPDYRFVAKLIQKSISK